MNLENDLKRALHREPPPAGFAGRVMERIEREQHQPRRRPVWWRAAAASVLFAVAVGGGYRLHEIRKGERAKEELLRAMSIASEKVRYAQQQVREIGSH